MIQKVLPSTTRAISKRHLPPLRRLPTRMSAFLTKRNSAQATTQSELLRYERSAFRALRSPKSFRESRRTNLTQKPASKSASTLGEVSSPALCRRGRMPKLKRTQSLRKSLKKLARHRKSWIVAKKTMLTVRIRQRKPSLKKPRHAKTTTERKNDGKGKGRSRRVE